MRIPRVVRYAPNPGLQLANAFGVNPVLQLVNAFGVNPPGCN